ncbi:MAG: hypothetical protein LUF92_01555 [Clostridiales bacterium]|nr:hypothetical protein [Clostridiales bacterium]
MYNLTLQDGGYLLIGGGNHPEDITDEQALKEMIQGLFRYMLNRPLIELNALEPKRLCDILHVESSEANIRFCTFVLLGFRQAFMQYLQSS